MISIKRQLSKGFINQERRSPVMKKIIASFCCFALLLAFGSDAWSATTKKRRHRKAAPAAAQPAVSQPEAAPAPAPPPPQGWWDKFETGWKKGLYFKSKDEKFSMKFRIRMQNQFQFNTNDVANKDSDFTFRVRRFKLSWDGNAFTKNLRYEVAVNLASLSPIQDMIEYVYVDYRFFDPLQVRVGQFKVPYNRQQITSSGRQEFVDRSLASDDFRFAAIDNSTTVTCTIPGGATVTGSGLGCGGGAVATTNQVNTSRRFQFDPGIMIHGDPWGKKMEYYIAVTNGSGPTRLSVGNGLLYTGRVVWNVLGQYGYSESDVDYSEHPAFFVGASMGYNDQDFTNNKFIQAGGETGFKYKGFSMQGEYFFRNNRINSITGLSGVTLGNTDDHAYYAQAGYFVIPKHFEIAARASQEFLAGANNDKSEFMGALNYYIFGHDLKLQADYALLPTQVNPATHGGDDKFLEHRFRVQLQAWF
jgi:phosphate-selective porin OprO and OprP